MASTTATKRPSIKPTVDAECRVRSCHNPPWENRRQCKKHTLWARTKRKAERAAIKRDPKKWAAYQKRGRVYNQRYRDRLAGTLEALEVKRRRQYVPTSDHKCTVCLEVGHNRRRHDGEGIPQPRRSRRAKPEVEVFDDTSPMVISRELPFMNMSEPCRKCTHVRLLHDDDSCVGSLACRCKRFKPSRK